MLLPMALVYPGNSRTGMKFYFCSEECRRKFLDYQFKNSKDRKGKSVRFEFVGRWIDADQPDGCDYCKAMSVEDAKKIVKAVIKEKESGGNAE